MSSSGDGAWNDRMIFRYYNAVTKLGGSKNLIKEIAIELGVPESEVQREAQKLNIGKSKKGKVKKGA
ncbi:unnamed protein product [Brassica napus]|uniref:(rape) hypothetical protein n=2 Tax=Brassica napus TaxID=3708 RepID=A0A816V4F2_BRANA|nr:unnamed protein product [Brassica napus]